VPNCAVARLVRSRPGSQRAAVCTRAPPCPRHSPITVVRAHSTVVRPPVPTSPAHHRRTHTTPVLHLRHPALAFTQVRSPLAPCPANPRSRRVHDRCRVASRPPLSPVSRISHGPAHPVQRHRISRPRPHLAAKRSGIRPARLRLAALDLGMDLGWVWRLRRGGGVRYGTGVCQVRRKIRWGCGMESGEIQIRAGDFVWVLFCASHCAYFLSAWLWTVSSSCGISPGLSKTI
jgi:hypothetical protein